jgi:hypothetical protein
MVDGVRVALGDRVLRAVLALTMAAAAGVLPVVSLLSPLLARSQDWGPRAAGVVAAAQGVGVLSASLVAARFGPSRRLGIGAAVALAVTGLGVAALATAPVVSVALGAAVVVGAGSGAFACHAGPLVLGSAPDTHISRIQSLASLVQALSLVIANNLLGTLADAAGPRDALAACALLTTVAGAVGLYSDALRGVGRGRTGPAAAS